MCSRRKNLRVQNLDTSSGFEAYSMIIEGTICWDSQNYPCILQRYQGELVTGERPARNGVGTNATDAESGPCSQARDRIQKLLCTYVFVFELNSR
jgi:hypothetical protein